MQVPLFHEAALHGKIPVVYQHKIPVILLLVKATRLHKAEFCRKNEDNFRNYCQLAKVDLFLQVS